MSRRATESCASHIRAVSSTGLCRRYTEPQRSAGPLPPVGSLFKTHTDTGVQAHTQHSAHTQCLSGVVYAPTHTHTHSTVHTHSVSQAWCTHPHTCSQHPCSVGTACTHTNPGPSQVYIQAPRTRVPASLRSAEMLRKGPLAPGAVNPDAEGTS